MAFTFASCGKKSVTNLDPSKLDDTVEKCWKTTCTIKAGGISGTDVFYVWGTERHTVISLQQSEKYSAGTAKYSYEAASTFKDVESCDAANVDL